MTTIIKQNDFRYVLRANERIFRISHFLSSEGTPVWEVHVTEDGTENLTRTYDAEWRGVSSKNFASEAEAVAWCMLSEPTPTLRETGVSMYSFSTEVNREW